MSAKEALALAEKANLDLVKIAPGANPPVCKIMDYGKFRFEREKREKEAKKKQQTVELKEIQLSCRIDTHDFETKARNAVKFLTAGNKVRVVVRFKGREMSHMDLGREVLEKFQMTDYFEAICGATLDGTRSHKADVIAYLLGQIGDVRSAVMVGDTAFDVLGVADELFDFKGKRGHSACGQVNECACGFVGHEDGFFCEMALCPREQLPARL